MAAGTVQVYANALLHLASKAIALDSDTFVAVLLSGSYTPDRLHHATWADVSAYEVADQAGYTPGGIALTAQAISITDAGKVMFDADDIAWGPPASITAQYAVIVRRASTVLADGDFLIGYADLNVGGNPLVSVDGSFPIHWNPAGIFTVG